MPLIFKGVIDASTDPIYPAASAGHIYVFSVSGKIGGSSGVAVTAQDAMICIVNTLAGDQATVGSHWSIMPANVLGQVIGPASATNGNIALFDTTSGKLIKDAGVGLASFESAGAAAVVQADLTAHKNATGAAVHGLGTASTRASGDFEAAGAVATHAGRTTGIHGLGTASQQDVAYFATAAQGAKADSAYTAAVTNAVSTNTANYIVKRDGSGNFAAGTITATLTGTATNLSGTPDLPNGTKATTQAQADGSTKLATTAYVDTGLATKVDSFGSKTANYILAAPSGSAGAPVFRAMTALDIPASITANTTGTAANLSGTPTLPNGTKATTQAAKDGSTKLATTTYADEAGTKLVITSVGAGTHNLTTATDLLAVTGITQVNLPAASGTRRVWRIKALAGTVTVTPNGADEIDGLSSIQLSGLPGVSQPTLALIDGGAGVWFKL